MVVKSTNANVRLVLRALKRGTMEEASFRMPPPFISHEEKFVTKPSLARNVSFRVLRSQPACLIKGPPRATRSMSACVGKVPVLFHRHICQRVRVSDSDPRNAVRYARVDRPSSAHEGVTRFPGCCQPKKHYAVPTST